MNENAKKAAHGWSLTEVLSDACKSVVQKAIHGRTGAEKSGQSTGGFAWSIVSEEGEHIPGDSQERESETATPAHAGEESPVLTAISSTEEEYPTQQKNPTPQKNPTSQENPTPQENAILSFTAAASSKKVPVFRPSGAHGSALLEGGRSLLFQEVSGDFMEMFANDHRTFDPNRVLRKKEEEERPLEEEIILPIAEKKPTPEFRPDYSAENRTANTVPDELFQAGVFLPDAFAPKKAKKRTSNTVLEPIADEEPVRSSDDDCEPTILRIDRRQQIAAPSLPKRKKGKRRRVPTEPSEPVSVSASDCVSQTQPILKVCAASQEPSEYDFSHLSDVWEELPENVRDTIISLVRTKHKPAYPEAR